MGELAKREASQEVQRRKGEKGGKNGREKKKRESAHSGAKAEKAYATVAAHEPPPTDASSDGGIGIDTNVILVAITDGIVYASPDSTDEISTVREGALLVASGPRVRVDGYDMVPLQPCGSVELRIVRKLSNWAAAESSPCRTVGLPEEAGARVVKTTKAARAAADEEDFDALLKEFGIVLQPVSPI